VTKEGIWYIFRTNLTFRKRIMAKKNRVINKILWEDVVVASPVLRDLEREA
jgi:hypothetical protein